MKKRKPDSISIAAARNRLTQERFCYLAGISVSTFRKQKAKGNYTLPMLQSLDRALHFTDEECVRLIKGV